MSVVHKTSLDAENVLDYGADPTGTTNSTAAFNAAITAALTNQRTGVFIPPGIYLIGDPTNPDPLTSHIRLNSVSDFTLFGAGAQTILREVGGDYGGNDGYAMIRVDGVAAARITLRDFQVDGNRGSVTNMGPNSHGILVKNGVDIVMDRLFVHDNFGAAGAAICMGGTDAGESVQLGSLRHCYAYQCNNAGIILRATTEAANLESCVAFDNAGDQYVIESVLSGGAIPSNIMMASCYADGTQTGEAFRVVATGAADKPETIIVSDCIFIGKVELDDVDEISISDCIILAADYGTLEGAITVNENVQDLSISSCLVLAQLDAGITANGIFFTGTGGTGRGNVFVRDCLVTAEGLTADAIIANSGNQANRVTAIEGCLILRGLTGRRGITIAADSASFSFDDITIRNNRFVGAWTDGISLRPNVGAIGAVTILANYFDVTADCIIFDDSATTFTRIPLVADNYSSGTEVRLFDLTKLASFPEPAICIGGNPLANGANAGSRAAGVKLLGSADPNAAVTGYRGDTFQDATGGAGVTLWVNTAAAGAAGTAWTAI